MAAVLTKAFAFIAVILLGYFLKCLHFFAKDDYKLVSKIMLDITLPAALITSFSNASIDLSMLAVILLGIASNLIMVLWGYFASRGKEDSEKAFCMLHYSGYNIGAFSLPFVQNFFGASAVVVISMFNMGSSMMTAGGTNAIVAAVSDSPEKESGFKAFKKMFSTLAFNICILLLILSLTGIRLPSFVLSAASLVGSANGFLSMLAIGMMLEVNFDTKRIGQAAKTLGARYLSATVFSLLIYFCLPFSLEIRQVLTLAVFSPVSALAPAFIEKNKGDVALSSVTSSLSILVSIPIMLLLLILNEL